MLLLGPIDPNKKIGTEDTKQSLAITYHPCQQKQIHYIQKRVENRENVLNEKGYPNSHVT